MRFQAVCLRFHLAEIEVTTKALRVAVDLPVGWEVGCLLDLRALLQVGNLEAPCNHSKQQHYYSFLGNKPGDRKHCYLDFL